MLLGYGHLFASVQGAITDDNITIQSPVSRPSWSSHFGARRTTEPSTSAIPEPLRHRDAIAGNLGELHVSTLLSLRTVTYHETICSAVVASFPCTF